MTDTESKSGSRWCIFGKLDNDDDCFDDDDSYGDDDHGGEGRTTPVMSGDAFIYLLLRLAADDESGSFRHAFEARPEEVMSRAGHQLRLDLLDGEEIKLPPREGAQELLRAFLSDYDARRLSGFIPLLMPINVDEMIDIYQNRG